uniref:LOB domain-containing protein n=1 Tax=Leersia perrieri TaxID=77586 RepID=A0A0D9XCZ2_9ORYZ
MTSTTKSNSISSSTTTTTNSSPNPPRNAAARVGIGGGGGGQSQACAACKYQRRKCNADCPLARYFPADDQRRFQNAHRLFGVSNIQKTLRRTPPELHADAMQALTFEADARAADPVGGAARLVKELDLQLKAVYSELLSVHHQIMLHQAAAAAAAAASENSLPPGMIFSGAGENEEDAMVDSFYVDQQVAEQYLVKDEVQPCLYYETAAAGDEGSSHAWTSGDNGGGENSTPMVLSDQLRQHYQIDQAAQVFDVKPEVTMVGHVDGGVVVGQTETKVAAAKAGSPSSSSAEAAAAARCQLELGRSL